MKRKSLYLLIVLLIGAAFWIAFSGQMNETTDPTQEEAGEQNQEEETTQGVEEIQSRQEEAEETATDRVTREFDYEDGDYQAEGMYTVPNGEQYRVAVALTLAGDTVSEVSVLFDDKEEGQTSTQFQSQFLEVYTSEVVGKDIDEVNLVRVGGASLTSQAFNDAVSEVRASAARA